MKGMRNQSVAKVGYWRIEKKMLETHSEWLMQKIGYVCNGRYKLCCVVWMVFAAELTFVTCSSVYLVHFCCCCLFVVQERIASVKREDSRTISGVLFGGSLWGFSLGFSLRVLS